MAESAPGRPTVCNTHSYIVVCGKNSWFCPGLITGPSKIKELKKKKIYKFFSYDVDDEICRFLLCDIDDKICNIFFIMKIIILTGIASNHSKVTYMLGKMRKYF